jgi:hypothetical protein
MKNKKLIIFTFGSLLALSSCASYKSASLNNPSSGVMTYSSAKKDDLIVLAKEFDKDDCLRYLDRDVITKGYQPIQLYIRNNSDKDFYFSMNRVSLACAKYDEVADKVHTSTVGRIAGYGVGALFIWPLAIPAIYDGIRSSEANDALDVDFASKAAKDMTIFRHSSFNKLIFVPRKEYQKHFQVTLVEQESKAPYTFQLEASGEF